MGSVYLSTSHAKTQQERTWQERKETKETKARFLLEKLPSCEGHEARQQRVVCKKLKNTKSQQGTALASCGSERKKKSPETFA